MENSPGLDLVLEWARAFTAVQRAETVGPGQLLEGLLVEEEGLPFRLLVEAGVAVDRLPVDRAVDRALGQGVPVGARVRHVLRRAQTLASWSSAEGTLTSDFVLLALLDMEEAARERVTALGLDWKAWQEKHPLEMPVIEMDEPLRLDEAPPTEVSRVLDAAANRAREALRVVEDFARFVLDDAYLTRELKTLRHDLAQVLDPLTAGLLRERDTPGDVGTDISTSREHQRGSARDVVLANSKRLQEALRSLEEFGKVHSAELGQAMERLRYRAYSIEKALMRDEKEQARLASALLYVLVSERLCKLSLFGVVREALEGGADVIQLREKDLTDRALLERAREIRKLTRDHGALFIVNDRPDIALLAGADGVHLGQDDLPLRAARRVLGSDGLIGVSTHDLAQLHEAIRDGASYLGIGPTFPSRTKEFGNLAGLEFIAQASQETSLPAFALGGIDLKNVDQAIASGAQRIAVSHAVCGADDPREAARALKQRLMEARQTTSSP